MLTSTATATATVALNALDAVLVLLQTFTNSVRFLLLSIFTSSDDNVKRPAVVIVGASFAGLHAQRQLCDSNLFDVTLVDIKDFFEYTPGVLRLFVEPDHLKNLAKPLPARRCNVAVAEVTNIGEDVVTVRQPNGSISTIPFDYLVLATGSNYPAIGRKNVIKAGPEQPTLQARAECWHSAAANLKKAESVLVIGGGPVGVELAAEVASAYPHKRVAIVSRSTRLCAALPEAVGHKCLRWLQRHQVEVYRGVSVTEARGDGATLSDGRVVAADIVYNCAGSLPNTAMLKGSAILSHVDPSTGKLIVNDRLSLEGLPHIFVVGDAMLHKRSNDLKLGHTAELNAAVAAENIVRLQRAKDRGEEDGPSKGQEGEPEEFALYPEYTTFGASRQAQVFCVSLGKHSAVMAFNGIVLSGWLPALVKWGLEWTKVAACEERPVGVAFWHLADSMTALLTRTVLPPPIPA